MPGEWLPAAISAVGGLISAGANAASNRSANNRSWRQTKQMFGMQQADRNAQNVYNSPANQVALLKSAGLSPASFYGGAAQSAGSAGVASPGQAEVNPTDFGTPISQVSGAIGNLTMLGEQKRNLQSDTELNIANMLKAMSDKHMTDFQRGLQEDIRETTIAQAQANLEKTVQESINLKAEQILTGVETEYRRMGIKYTESQISLNDKQKQLWDAEMVKLGFDIKESQSRTALNYANVSVANQTAREICYSIEHLMPAMVADYAASADLKTTQAWDNQENAKFQQWYNEHILDYLPAEIKAKIDNMNKDTKVKTQQNVRDWIKLPAEFIRDAGIGIGAVAKPLGELLAPARGKIGY